MSSSWMVIIEVLRQKVCLPNVHTQVGWHAAVLPAMGSLGLVSRKVVGAGGKVLCVCVCVGEDSLSWEIEITGERRQQHAFSFL